MREHLPRAPVWFLSCTVVFFVLLFLLLLDANMRKELNHDEHQFIAAGALASRSLIPYRDYPYTHTPYLAIIYGAVFAHTGHFLLAGRAVSTICDFAALGLTFFVTSNLFKDRPFGLRFALAAGAALMLFTNPLFIDTTGLAWNHAAPELATLAAFVLQIHGVAGRRGATWTFVSGALLGLASGLRVTFASAIIPLGSLIALSLDPPRPRLRLLLSFAAGVGLGIFPALLMLLLYPQQFIFGVIRYPQLDAIWQRETGFAEAVTAPAGVLPIVAHMLGEPGNLMLAFSFVVSLWALSAAGVRASLRQNVAVTGTLILVPFLLIAPLVKDPPFFQYFYAPIPFLVLGIPHAVAAMGTRRMTVLAALGLAVVVSSISGLPHYLHVRHFLSLDAWVPLQAHRVGAEIRRTAGVGRVLTLAPIFPLEAGAKIYCALASGPFTWRSAYLLPAAERERVGIVSPDDLNRLLKEQAPAAVLVGFERELDTPLRTYAQHHGYTRSRLSSGADLWVPPDASVAHGGDKAPGTSSLPRAQRTDVGMADAEGSPCAAPGEAHGRAGQDTATGMLTRGLDPPSHVR